MAELQHAVKSDGGESDLFGDFSIYHLEVDNFVRVQMYTQKRHSFNTGSCLPGELGRLPPEVRFMIYDYLLPTGPEFSFYTSAGQTQRSFELLCDTVPNLPQVCGEMRDYVISKGYYKRIWCICTTSPKPLPIVRVSHHWHAPTSRTKPHAATTGSVIYDLGLLDTRRGGCFEINVPGRTRKFYRPLGQHAPSAVIVRMFEHPRSATTPETPTLLLTDRPRLVCQYEASEASEGKWPRLKTTSHNTDWRCARTYRRVHHSDTKTTSDESNKDTTNNNHNDPNIIINVNHNTRIEFRR
ncbi:hypothetical protein F4808DRAFT_444295 [Astrocystis sublimbata]|nr:hypothetical protein F4808DRAFT_444295 [Astrocystis sublimbata]